MEILPGISVIVEPASSAFFAGELMQWKITFRNDRQPARKLETLFPVARNGDIKGHRHALSIATSAPAMQSTIDRKRSNHPGSTTPASPGSAISPSRSFVDFNNADSESTHLVLPTRRGNMGTQLAQRPLRSTRSQNGSRHLLSEVANSATLAPLIHLYEAKRAPAGLVRHKKNDYSVAIGHQSGNLVSSQRSGWLPGSEEVLDNDNAVLDLSSQLAGLAMLQQQAPPINTTDRHCGIAQTQRLRSDLAQRPLINRATSFNGTPIPEDAVADIGQTPPSKAPSPARHNRAVSAFSGVPPLSAPPFERTPISSLPPDSDTSVQILWSYAKFDGSFVIDPTLIRDHEFQAVKHAMFGDAQHLHGRVAAGGASEAVIGGGTLNMEPDTPSAPKSSWSSWLWRQSDDAASNISSTRSSSAGAQAESDNKSQPSRAPASRKLHRTVTFTSDAATAGSLEGHRQRILQSSNMPIITCPNSIVAVDLRLLPGESRSCKHIRRGVLSFI